MQKTTRPSKLAASAFIGAAITLLSGISYAGIAPKAKGPTPTVRIEPGYPIAAAQQRIEGHVVMKFDISAAGKVSNVSVIDSQPEGIFDKEAVKALQQWQYQPSQAGAQGTLIQLSFRLGSEPLLKTDSIENLKVSNH